MLLRVSRRQSWLLRNAFGNGGLLLLLGRPTKPRRDDASVVSRYVSLSARAHTFMKFFYRFFCVIFSQAPAPATSCNRNACFGHSSSCGSGTVERGIILAFSGCIRASQGITTKEAGEGLARSKSDVGPSPLSFPSVRRFLSPGALFGGAFREDMLTACCCVL